MGEHGSADMIMVLVVLVRQASMGWLALWQGYSRMMFKPTNEM